MLGVPDGSGKAIRMEAPVARAWKKATGYTKWSYYALVLCVFMIYFGYRWLRYNHASIHLTCHTEECTFSITPQGWNKSHKVVFPRHQLIRAEAMKVTKEGMFVELSPRLDNFKDLPGKGKQKYKKKTTSYKGPDQNSHYPSYRITLRDASDSKPPKADNNEQTGDSVDGSAEVEIDDVRLTDVMSFMEKGENDEYTIIIRQFGINQSRRRVKTTVQKIDSYIKRRRHKLTMKENAPPSWQGILLLVLGLFGLLLSLLIGQFWDEPNNGHNNNKNKRQSGPGARATKRVTPGQRSQYGIMPSSASRGKKY